MRSNKTNPLILFLMVYAIALSVNAQVDELQKKEYPLKSITKICRKMNRDSANSATITYFRYDSLKRLTKSYTFINEVDTGYNCIYTYGLNGKVSSRKCGLNDNYRVRIYNYDHGEKLIYEGYHDPEGNNTENNYSYNDQNLIQENFLTCNYNKVRYEFEYNSNGQITDKWKNGELIEKLQYKDNLLTLKTKYFRNKESVVNYLYDDNNQLVSVIEDGNVIQKNEYKDGKLFLKRTYYFGIDPCYDLCCMKYDYKYTYYE